MAAAETTVEVMIKEVELELELDEPDELEELGVRELVLIIERGPLATTNNVTTLQVEPRLYWKSGVKTARTPLQSADKSVYFIESTRTCGKIPDTMVAPLIARDSWHWLLIETV